MSDTFTGYEVQVVAEALLADYDSEFNASHLRWQDFEWQARKVLLAVAPAIAARALREAATDYGTPGATATTSYVRGFLRDRADEIEATP